VDDRALNRHVWESLAGEMSGFPSDKKPRVLEIGAGIGTMIERVLKWGLFSSCEYTALDQMDENIEFASSHLPEWASNLGYSVEALHNGLLRMAKDGREVIVTLERADVFDFMSRHKKYPGRDLLIANAFLDLVDVREALPDLLSLLQPGGLFYFTVNFDGVTAFQPEIDYALDAKIESLYHQTMDRRVISGKASGDSRTGRHFFNHVRAAGAKLIDAGSSDWVVFAGPDGYAGDESFFLHFIIHTIACALDGHPELDSEAFREWVDTRHSQIENGTLVYLAHQMDFLGKI